MKILLLATVFAVFAVNIASANNCYSFSNKTCAQILSEDGVSVPPPCSGHACSQVYPGVYFCNTTYGFQATNTSLQRETHPSASGTTRYSVSYVNQSTCVQIQGCNGCDVNNICKGGNWYDYGSSNYLTENPYGDACP